MKLLTYTVPKLLGYHPTATIYSLISSGLRVGIGQRGDITGNQGMGRGARVVRDELGTFAASLSTGRAESTLYKLTRKGRGKRAHFVRRVIDTRGGARGTALGKRARSVGVSAEAIAGYRFTSGIIVGLLFAICTILLTAYKLNKGMTIKMANELAQRRQQTAGQPQFA